MAKLLWAIPCRDSAVDQDSNALYIFHVLEVLSVPEDSGDAPEIGDFLQINSTLITMWSREELGVGEKIVARFDLLTPDNKLFEGKEQEIDLEQYKRVRVRSKIPHLPFGGEGNYFFTIMAKPFYREGEWEEIGSVPVEVEVDRA